jgi:hypothetical protein
MISYAFAQSEDWLVRHALRRSFGSGLKGGKEHFGVEIFSKEQSSQVSIARHLFASPFF